MVLEDYTLDDLELMQALKLLITKTFTHINFQNAIGNTILHKISILDYSNCAQYLISSKCYLFLRNNENKTALEVAGPKCKVN